ncbi:MAG: ATP-binding cassette domain-containing protein [Bifidobacterium minimum]|nr:ATP-binding cassette domain-containing protein [Bifidobacterium minimum]
MGTMAGRTTSIAQPSTGMRHTLGLDHVSLSLGTGETVAVMGPSGSGKSTLLHVLAGILPPTSGTVSFHGRDIGGMPDSRRTALRRKSFGFVFQSGQLLPELPAVENIALPMMMGGVPYDQAVSRAMLWLERMGLRELSTHRPGEMSGGQMQRVAIARALCVEPEIVFAAYSTTPGGRGATCRESRCPCSSRGSPPSRAIWRGPSIRGERTTPP